MKISACLVIHNEEALLPRCLDSIKGIADEVIIVHDGECTDNSLNLAKKYSAKIFIRSYIGEAEYHRPFLLERARGEWILQIDADEYLSDKLRFEILNLIENSQADAYSFLWPYSIDGYYFQSGPFSQTLKPCLFRRRKMFMIGISHEYPRTFGKLIKRNDLILEHKPLYNNFLWETFKTKWSKWADIHARQILSLPRAPLYNISKPQENHIFRYYIFLAQHPLIDGFIESTRFIIIFLVRGLLFAGTNSYKIACMEISYLWLVRFKLIRYGYGKK